MGLRLRLKLITLLLVLIGWWLLVVVVVVEDIAQGTVVALVERRCLPQRVTAVHHLDARTHTSIRSGRARHKTTKQQFV